MYLAVDRGRFTEDVFRSVGAVLDAHMAREVLIRELADGLYIRARVLPSVEHRLSGHWLPLERVFTSAELLEARVAAVGRRGTDHRAGPLERALRIVGRAADERDLAGLVLIQHPTDGGWMIWHTRSVGAQPELFTLSHSELNDMDMTAERTRLEWLEPDRAMDVATA